MSKTKEKLGDCVQNTKKCRMFKTPPTGKREVNLENVSKTKRFGGNRVGLGITKIDFPQTFLFRFMIIISRNLIIDFDIVLCSLEETLTGSVFSLVTSVGLKLGLFLKGFKVDLMEDVAVSCSLVSSFAF